MAVRATDRPQPLAVGRGAAWWQVLIPLAYGVAAFVSATLLFVIQPMFARMLLPLLGGAPAVWNTALVFYQGVLLAGYLYAHLTTRWLGPRRQGLLHAVLVFLPLLVLPIAVPGGWNPPTTSNPAPWLLALLTVAVGLPFFVISTSSPLLQAWYARTGHRMAADPYILYAASNVGSMAALLGYPTIIEPRLQLADQSRLWSLGYFVLIGLILACAALVARAPQVVATVKEAAAAVAATTTRLTTARRLRWLALAFVPSSLMMSVTTYITTQIAPLPLLWVIPLAIYLLTFILVFAGRPLFSQRVLVRTFPLVLLILVLLMLIGATQPIALIAGLHLVVFFVATMICHGAMAADRPEPAHLTEFYLWMSAGGVLGGIFNALVAPVIFPSIIEYPLVLAVACLLLPRFGADAARPFFERRDIILPLILAAVLAALLLGIDALNLNGDSTALLLIFGLPVVFCFSFSRRPLRFALGIGALFLVTGLLYTSGQGRELATERSFFGLHRIMLEPTGRFHTIVHGGTVHGMQAVDPARATLPLTYYYPTGPIGQVFTAYSGADAKNRVGVVGLGAGTLACYQQPGQAWTFYELDPRVEQIARDPRYFTYLRDCAPDSPVVLGDGRLQLVGAAQGGYDLLVLDAYSSDTVPVHLLTREALALYLDKLAPNGIIAFHVSNQYLDLKPVVARLAEDAGLVALSQDDFSVTAEEAAAGKSPSQWVVMARSQADLAPLNATGRWKPLVAAPGTALWTDNFSSILELIRWK